MIKNTLIILILLIIVALFYCFYYKENFTGNDTRMKQIFGNRGQDVNKRNEVHHSSALEIGTDEDDNKVFQFRGKMFKMNEDNVLEINDPKKINYKKVPIKLPIMVTDKLIKSKVPLKYDGYTFMGIASNKYYKQYYLIYEKEYKDPDLKDFKDKLYSYLLMKNDSGKLKTIHNTPPRTRIEPGDNVYFSYGNFQLGPLTFI